MTRQTALPNFAEEIRALVGESKKLPPVMDWHPEREGEIDIRIASDGRWYYEGAEMEREALVQLFSTIMRRDGDDYFLVTPAEKLKITVELCPFVVRLIDVESQGRSQKVHCSTNVGDAFTLSAEHPLSMFSKEGGEAVPVAEVRNGLTALLNRNVFYELAELALENEDGNMGVWSDGQFFQLEVTS